MEYLVTGYSALKSFRIKPSQNSQKQNPNPNISKTVLPGLGHDSKSHVSSPNVAFNVLILAKTYNQQLLKQSNHKYFMYLR